MQNHAESVRVLTSLRCYGMQWCICAGRLATVAQPVLALCFGIALQISWPVLIVQSKRAWYGCDCLHRLTFMQLIQWFRRQSSIVWFYTHTQCDTQLQNTRGCQLHGTWKLHGFCLTTISKHHEAKQLRWKRCIRAYFCTIHILVYLNAYNPETDLYMPHQKHNSSNSTAQPRYNVARGKNQISRTVCCHQWDTLLTK